MCKKKIKVIKVIYENIKEKGCDGDRKIVIYFFASIVPCSIKS